MAAARATSAGDGDGADDGGEAPVLGADGGLSVVADRRAANERGSPGEGERAGMGDKGSGALMTELGASGAGAACACARDIDGCIALLPAADADAPPPPLVLLSSPLSAALPAADA